MSDSARMIEDFVASNRKPLAGFVRQKLIAANAKPYLDSLGKEGIENLEREAAGVLLDLACALLRRIHPERTITAEGVLNQFSESVRKSIKLPRSEAYHAALDALDKARNTEPIGRLQREELHDRDVLR